MCGIAGILRAREGAEDRAVVESMMQRIVARGPDDSGVESAGRATLGNRRLAILDLSNAGHQPMSSASGRYLITFNGEIYNYRELRDELGVDPGALRSGSDTEVILHAWERWGAESLERMVGQWAFAIYDRVEETLWLCRDRFGEKPLFYHEDRSVLAFASSVPALLEAPWVPRSIDQDALLEYVTMRYVVSPRTIVAGVRKLPGGHLLRATPSGVSVERWYDPRFRPRDDLPGDDALVEEFDELLARASRRCLVSDVPVALLLSDGIDSRSIRASLAGHGRPVHSYTYALAKEEGGLSASDENDGMGEVTELAVTPGDRVQQMVPAFSSLTEPVGDGAALATWLLIRNARAHATVFLCGHGGDEVLGGYRLSQDRFRLQVVHRLARLPLALVSDAIDRFVNGDEPVAQRRHRLRDARPPEVPAAARYMIHRPLPPADVRTIYAPGPVPPGYLRTVDALYGRSDESATDIDRMQEVMLATFLSENILTFADSVAMDSSAELRMPFLDRDLVAFVLGLPDRLRVSRFPGRANTKLILRRWAQGRLPADVTTRRKRSFPFGNLPELLETEGDTIRGRILDCSAVSEHLPGLEGWLRQEPGYFRGPWEGTLWALLALGIWCEHAGVRAG